MGKKKIIRSILIISAIGFFCYHTIYNNKGIIALKKKQQEIVQEQNAVNKLEQQIAKLQHACSTWDADPFEREKVVRQELQMTYTNEYVYLTNK